MRVFVTGGTGFIGSAIVQELIAAGHHVTGLARSDAAAKSLTDAGAQVHRGSLDDHESMRGVADSSDGVIHCAFIHDFSDYAASVQTDRLAIETLGAALAQSGRPLVVTGGTLGIAAAGVATEDDPVDPNSPRLSERAALALVPDNVRASVVRLSPSVHGKGDHGFVPALIGIAREKGVSAYVGDGLNRWPAVHRLDAATLFRLALEKGSAGARFHGAADEGVAIRDIAEVIGRRLNISVVSKSREEAADHFGWLGDLVAMDNPTSSAKTQHELGWHPTQPGLLADLDNAYYFEERINA